MATILTGLIAGAVLCLFAASLSRSGRNEPPVAPLDLRPGPMERKVARIDRVEMMRMLRASLESERDTGRISEEECWQLREYLALRGRVEAAVASRRARSLAGEGGIGPGLATGGLRRGP